MADAIGNDFIISVRGKQFVLSMDAELIVGIGNDQFKLALDAASQTVYLTDPRTGEKLSLNVKDVLVGGVSIVSKLDVIDHIKDIIDVSVTGLNVVDDAARVTIVSQTPLNINNLASGSPVEIGNLPVGALIYQIDLNVTTPFTTDPDVQHNISVVGDNEEVIYDAEWNDPNIEGNYCTQTNYTIGESGKVSVVHDLTNMVAGIAELKLYCALPKSE